MSAIKDKTKVYILGAGCSAKYGCPLARDFVPNLESFAKTLGTGAEKIRRCVEDTAATMRRHNVQTVDDLAFRLRHRSIGNTTGSPIEDDQRSEHQIRNAKLAATALLLSSEKTARGTGLGGYRDLLLEISQQRGSWERELQTSKCRVLTFNYDRLFEIALLEFVGPDLACKGLYEYLLNSGFTPFGGEISFRNEGFCFLKLHGSVGSHVGFWGTQPQFQAVGHGYNLDGQITLTDELLFSGYEDRNRLRSEPLIIFPHEKHHVESGGRHLVYEKYLIPVWQKAKEIMAEAQEIHVIGYSFAAMDRVSVMNLLSAASNCQQIVIQNVGGEAERICQMLSVKHPDFKITWTPFNSEF